MDDSIKNAMKYISEVLKDAPDSNMPELVDETSRKFNLSPMQTEFLTNKFVLGK